MLPVLHAAVKSRAVIRIAGSCRLLKACPERRFHPLYRKIVGLSHFRVDVDLYSAVSRYRLHILRIDHLLHDHAHGRVIQYEIKLFADGPFRYINIDVLQPVILRGKHLLYRTPRHDLPGFHHHLPVAVGDDRLLDQTKRPHGKHRTHYDHPDSPADSLSLIDYSVHRSLCMDTTGLAWHISEYALKIAFSARFDTEFAPPRKFHCLVYHDYIFFTTDAIFYSSAISFLLRLCCRS